MMLEAICPSDAGDGVAAAGDVGVATAGDKGVAGGGLATLAAPDASTSWRSTRAGQINWNFAEVDKTAHNIIDELPVAALEIINLGKYSGTSIVTLPKGNVMPR